MAWQEIHTGGWLCSETGDYVYTGGGAPSQPCGVPLPDPIGTPSGSGSVAFFMRDPETGAIYPVTGENLAAMAQSLGINPMSIPQDQAGMIDLVTRAFAAQGVTVEYYGQAPPADPSGTGVTPGQETDNPFLAPTTSGGGSGGGGGGRVAPTFVAPDRRTVEDAVKGTLIALTGRFDAARAEMLTDLYLSEAEANFNSTDAQINPMESVKEKIRSFGDYQRVHELRPEEIDEMEWIATRQGALVNLGLNEERAVELGVGAAQAGLTQEDTTTQGQTQEFVRTGQAKFGLEDKLRQSARAGIGLLR